MLRPVTRWQVSSCQVLGVIAGSLEGLAHGYQMIAFADWLPFGILYMPDNHQIAQAVELGIVAEHYQGPGDIALDKGFAGIPDYNRHNRSHRDQLAQIMAIHAGANGAKTVHSVQQPIADALPLSNEFQASQELSRLHLGANPGDQPGYAVVDFMIGAIQFLFVVAYRVQGVFGAGFQPRHIAHVACGFSYYALPHILREGLWAYQIGATVEYNGPHGTHGIAPPSHTAIPDSSASLRSLGVV